MNTEDKTIQDIKEMISEIYYVVIGSEHDKQMGLIERVKSLETEQEKQKSFLSKITWLAIGMAAPASWGLVEFVLKVFIDK